MVVAAVCCDRVDKTRLHQMSLFSKHACVHGVPEMSLAAYCTR